MSKTVTVRVPTVRPRIILGLLIAAALVALIAPSLPIYYHAPLGVWSSDRTAGAATKLAFAQRMDALADRLPEQELLRSRSEWINWAYEIIPYANYEGLVPGEAVVPYDLVAFWARTARNFHVAGQAACRDPEGQPIVGPVALNLRYINRVSPWYGSEHSLGVLVHELVHMQGGPFCSGASEDLEANTQIASHCPIIPSRLVSAIFACGTSGPVYQRIIDRKMGCSTRERMQ